MHYAKVICERYQNSWKVYGTLHVSNTIMKNRVIQYGNTLVNKDFDDTSYFDKDYYQSRYKDSKNVWEKDIGYSKGFSSVKLKNGEHVLWKGDINQERLRVSDNLYIPTIDKYLPIERVEVTPNGAIMYYVNHIEYFSDTEESDRLRELDKWFENNFPNLDKFSDLHDYVQLDRKEFEETIAMFEPDEKGLEECRRAKEEAQKMRKEFEGHNLHNDKSTWSTIDTGVENIKIKKTTYIPTLSPQDKEEDLKWQQTVLICGVGAVVIMALMFIFGLK